MAIPFTPQDVGSGFNLTKLNENFQNIDTAFQDALSRSGASPNQMEADIDLNSNDLLNVNQTKTNELFINGVLVTPDALQTIPASVMLKATYDPQDIEADVFSRDNHTGPVVWPADTRTVLKALNTSAFTTVYLKEAGREGLFKWTLGDFSTQIAADTLEGVYIKADAIATTVGAWVREVGDKYLATWFGLVEGSSSGNAAAIQSATKVANGVFPVVIPPGDYTVTAKIPMMAANTHLIGYGAKLRKAADHTLIEIPIGTHFVTVEGLHLFGGDIGRGAAVRANGNFCTVKYCEIEGFGDAALPTPVGWAIYFDGEFSAGVVGCKALFNYVHDCDGAGVGQYASADSQIIGNRLVNLGLEGVSSDRSGGNHNIIADNIINNVCLVAGVGGIGVDTNNYVLIANNQIRNSAIGAGITAQNNVGSTDHLTIVGNLLVGNNGRGIWLKNTPAGGGLPGGITTNAYIVGNKFRSNGTSIVIDAGCTGNTIGDNDYGNDAVPGVPNGTKGLSQLLSVRNTAIRTDQTGDGTIYTIPFDTVEVAKGISYNPATGVATINVAGYYQFDAGVRVEGLTSSHTEIILAIDPSTGVASRATQQLNAGATPTVAGANITGRIVQCAVGDTFSVSVRVLGGTKVVDVSADSSFTYFSGRLVSPL